MPAVRQDLVSFSVVLGWCREVVLQVVEALFHQDARCHELTPLVLEQVLLAEVPWGELAPGQFPSVERGRVQFPFHGSGRGASLRAWCWGCQGGEGLAFLEALRGLPPRRQNGCHWVWGEFERQVICVIELRPSNPPAHGGLAKLLPPSICPKDSGSLDKSPVLGVHDDGRDSHLRLKVAKIRFAAHDHVFDHA